MRRVLRPLALASVGAVVLGCIGKDPYAPGTGLGTFHVTGTLKTSSCGDAPNPWVFDVKLATDPGTLYWIQGSVPVSGKLDASHVATLSDTATNPVASDKAGNVQCVMERDDALGATLVPDTTMANEYSSFTGSLTYTFKVGDGSIDCSSQLTANGGSYAALPCSVSYALSATRTALPNQYGK